MNDRYLFKAKRKNWKDLPKEEWWVQGALFDGENCCLIGQEIKFSPYVENECKIVGYEVDRATICQCTGWKDKKKNLIWENDIVTDGDFVGVVKFGYYEYGEEAENIGFYIDWHKIGYRKDLGYWLDKISVDGSVFGNPELEVE